MKVGDLITFKSTDPLDKRSVGTILNFDTHTWNDSAGTRYEPIIEVLWNTSRIDWIASRRVEVVNESR